MTPKYRLPEVLVGQEDIFDALLLRSHELGSQFHHILSLIELLIRYLNQFRVGLPIYWYNRYLDLLCITLHGANRACGARIIIHL